jgi:transcriptional regulator with XRE-family HTH domain
MAWTQKEAAEKIGVSQQNVSAWLNDIHEPSVEQALNVARVLGVSVEELFRAPGPVLREERSAYITGPNFERWFRQCRVSWHDHPEERHRIKTGIELAWPNQAKEILNWLETKPSGE